mgnify:CR=1 FL=1
MANLIAAERISLALGTSQLLDEVSLGVGTGDRIGIVGRNGGGKTTLLSVLAGNQSVDTGRLTRTGGLAVGLLTQQDGMAADTTVAQAVLGDRAEHEWAGEARVREILDGLLGGVSLSAVGGHDALVGPLSGGERRRISLARLLIDDPDVLLLDEPFTGLDAPNTESLLELFEELSHRGTSIIMSTHNLSEAAHSCHRLILFNGTVVADDSASRLLRQTDPWTHTFGVRAGSPLLSSIGVSA